ncbi:unnamed protein product [Albugo candida]|uniref:COMM domain-containing protein n=2 Tax=Albugo candida TaxID=65357 RepID=A0A024GEU6_9STRA|nr:unnamed protein product [Albugo candida]|eukprot:CCI44852.1 unnamed protein product [Albugo candida]
MSSYKLKEFDYSVRVNIANDSVCYKKVCSVVMRLELEDRVGSIRNLILELSAQELAQMIMQMTSTVQRIKEAKAQNSEIHNISGGNDVIATK